MDHNYAGLPSQLGCWKVVEGSYCGYGQSWAFRKIPYAKQVGIVVHIPFLHGMGSRSTFFFSFTLGLMAYILFEAQNKLTSRVSPVSCNGFSNVHIFVLDQDA